MKKGFRKFVKIDDGTGRKLILRTQYPAYIFEIDPQDEADIAFRLPGGDTSIAVKKDFHQAGAPSVSFLVEAIRYYLNDILKNQPDQYYPPAEQGLIDAFRRGLAPDGWESKPEPYDKADLFELLNASYLADKCFGKTRQWFYQRTNKSSVNGKEKDFTPEQRKQLADFLMKKADEITLYANDLIGGNP